MKLITLTCTAALLILLAGCSEKPEVTVQKTGQIPEQNTLSDTETFEALINDNLPSETQVSAFPVSNTNTRTPASGNKNTIKTPAKTGKTASNPRLQTQNETGLTDVKDIQQSQETQEPKTNTAVSLTSYNGDVYFIPGECLVYSIKWNFANIGKLLLACREETFSSRKIYHIMGITLPEGIWSKFGYGYNRFDSFVDGRTKLPFFYYGYSASLKNSQITKTTINQKDKKIVSEVKKFRDNVEYSSRKETSTFNFDVIYDGLSALYALRGTEMEKNRIFCIPVGITKTCSIKVSILGKLEKIFPFFGKKEYFLTESEASIDEGMFRKGKLLLGISSDTDRVPLFFKGSVPLGSGNVDLVSRTNLGQNFSTDSVSLTKMLISLK